MSRHNDVESGSYVILKLVFRFICTQKVIETLNSFGNKKSQNLGFPSSGLSGIGETMKT